MAITASDWKAPEISKQTTKNPPFKNKMRNTNIISNQHGNGTSNPNMSIGGASPGISFRSEQRNLDRHTLTATPTKQKCKQARKWTKEMNIKVMKCYLKCNPNMGGYRKRFIQIWKDNGGFEVTEQQLVMRIYYIKTRNWLTESEIEEIKRQCNTPKRTGLRSTSRQNTPQEPESSLDSNTENESSGAEEDESIQGSSNIALEPEDNNLSEDELTIVEKIRQKLEPSVELNTVNLRSVNWQQINDKVKIVNNVISRIQTKDLNETNRLLLAGANVVKDLLLIKEKSTNKGEPWWKWRIKRRLGMLRKDLSQAVELNRGNLNQIAKDRLIKRYSVEKYGVSNVIETLKQRVKATAARLKKYEDRHKQFIQNKLFRTNQKLVYEMIEGKEARNKSIKPDATNSVALWDKIWNEDKDYNHEAEWIKKVERGTRRVEVQNDIQVDLAALETQLKGTANWKAAGPDRVQAFWIKRFTALHERLVVQLNAVLEHSHVPEWMTSGRTFLILKDPEKGNEPTNYRPITCLPIMWKVLTGIIASKIYQHLENNRLIPDEQKGCRRDTRGTKDQLVIDKMITADCIKRQTNLNIAWIDYRKAFDMVPHSWINRTLDIYKVAKNARKLLKNSMAGWNTKLMVGGDELGHVRIRRGIFQGDSLSPLIFIMAMMPLTTILNKTRLGYMMDNDKIRINHLLFMDDLKLYGKTAAQLDSLVNSVHLFSKDIGMEFGIDKCAVIQMKRGKLESSDGLQLPDGSKVPALETKDTYKYLGILQNESVRNKQTKDIIRKEYYRRTRKILQSKLNAGNIFKAINARAVSMVRYGAGIVDWYKHELETIDRRTRKLLTLHGAFHPKSSIERLYMKRKDGGRGLLNIHDTVDLEKASLGYYVSKSTEEMLQLASRREVVGDNQNPIEKSRKQIEERRARFSEKKLHSVFFRITEDVSDEKVSWMWMRNGYLKKNTEATIVAAQEQAIRTRAISSKIDKSGISPLCRVCGKRDETISHLLTECGVLANSEYKTRHDGVAAIVHWGLCRKYGIECVSKSYNHKIPRDQRAIENDKVKILWDFLIQTDRKLDHNRPDIVVVDKVNKTCDIIDIACPWDARVQSKERDKIERYEDLKHEILKCWKPNVKRARVIPIVVGALGTATSNLKRYLTLAGVPGELESIQKTTLLGSARIIRKVMGQV